MKLSRALFALGLTGLIAVHAQALTKQQVLQTLAAQVLHPSASLDAVVARMTPEPLTFGLITPNSGGFPTVSISGISGNPQWFVMVDYQPCAMFGHPMLYVFIDDVTGVVSTFDALDWPALDGSPLDRNFILVLPMVPRPSTVAGQPSPLAPIADYGDAPDNEWAIGASGEG